MSARTPPSNRSAGPVDRAFHLLQTLVAAGQPLGVRELGRRTGLPRSTTSRLVGTLEQLGMVDRTVDGDVVPGGALATLNPRSITTPQLSDRLRPLLSELVRTFGEDAALAVDDGDALLYISQVASRNLVSVQDVSGERHPFHLVAPGLVVMAWWPPERLTDHLTTERAGPTPNSVVGAKSITKRLRLIRRVGFAWTNEELDVGINGLAVPILDGDELVATVSLYGPSYRLSPEARPNLAEDLLALVRQRVPAVDR